MLLPWPLLSWVTAADTPSASYLWFCSFPNHSPHCSRVIFIKCIKIMLHPCLIPFNGVLLLSSLSSLREPIRHFIIWFKFNFAPPSVLTTEDPATKPPKSPNHSILSFKSLDEEAQMSNREATKSI